MFVLIATLIPATHSLFGTRRDLVQRLARVLFPVRISIILRTVVLKHALSQTPAKFRTVDAIYFMTFEWNRDAGVLLYFFVLSKFCSCILISITIGPYCTSKPIVIQRDKFL